MAPDARGVPRAGPLAALCLALSCTGCSKGPSRAVIGYAFPATGRITVAVARSEIANRARPGEIPIRIVYDSTTTGEPTDVEVQRALRLAAIPGLVGVVGHGGSRGSLAAAPVYNQAKIPQLVPLGTSRLLAKAGAWTFTLAPNDSIEGEFLAQAASERFRARSVTIAFENDEYGIGLLSGVSAGLQRRGVRILDELRVDPATDVATVAEASFRRSTPDLVISASRWRGTGVLAQVAQRHISGMRTLAGDGAGLLPALATEAGPAADSIYIAAFWLPDAPDSTSRAFVERFRRLQGREPLYTEAMSHDAIMIIAQAVREVGADREGIRRFLTALGRTRPPYPGITGPVSFLPDRPAGLVMARVRGNRLVRAEVP